MTKHRTSRRGPVFFYKLRRRYADIFFELSAEKADVREIAELRDLCYRVAFKPQKLAGVVYFQLNYIFFRRKPVFFLEDLFEIGLAYRAELGKLGARKVL